MTNKTPQEQSALEKLGEAALAWISDTSCTPVEEVTEPELVRAAEAYRATQAPPRECRPPGECEGWEPVERQVRLAPPVEFAP